MLPKGWVCYRRVMVAKSWWYVTKRLVGWDGAEPSRVGRPVRVFFFVFVSYSVALSENATIGLKLQGRETNRAP